VLPHYVFSHLKTVNQKSKKVSYLLTCRDTETGNQREPNDLPNGTARPSLAVYGPPSYTVTTVSDTSRSRSQPELEWHSARDGFEFLTFREMVRFLALLASFVVVRDGAVLAFCRTTMTVWLFLGFS
jgi:hypothetical protein